MTPPSSSHHPLLLVLTPPVQAPDFRLKPVRKLVPAARGGRVRMECRPRAAPKPTLFWSRGTELLVNSSRYWTVVWT